MKLKKTAFTESLVRINRLRFNKWVFDSGMLFLSGSKWWADKGARGGQHNGLDLLSYEAPDGTHQTIDTDTKIPIIYDGRIVRCVKDFLGSTLFAAHEIHEGSSRLFTIYGHVVKSSDISIDKMMKEGTVIASLAKTSGTKVPPHLHISVAFIPASIPFEALSWELLNGPGNIRLLDPADII